MEKKFESELGKRIVEGKKRGSSRKVIMGIGAVGACALLFMAASYTFAASENSPVVITEKTLYSQETDYYTASVDGDADLQRTMSLNYRSTLPPGNGDLGNTKLIYSVNMQVKDTTDIVFTDMIVGELSVTFGLSVTSAVYVSCLVMTTDADGNAVTFTVSQPNEIVYGTDVAVDAVVPSQYTYIESTIAEDGTVTEETITADYTVSAGDSLSWAITIATFHPDMTGSFAEVAWPGLVDYVRAGTF